MNEKALAIAKKANKKLGEGTVMVGSEMRHHRLPRVTSGIMSVDVMLGGGWVANQWIEVVGNESAGKSLLALVTIAANQRLDPEWTAVWFAAEHFVWEYAEMLGVDLNRILVVNENIMESVYQQAIEYLEERAVDCLVIDSLPALVASATKEADMEDVEVALEARLNSRFWAKAAPSLRRSLVEDDRPVLCFVINQWRERIGVRYGDPRTTPGGKKKNFIYFMRVDVAREEFITNTKGDPIGQVIRVRNIKNKTAPPGRRAVFDAYVDDGNGFKAGEIDVVKDMIAVGLSYEVIGRPNNQTYLVGGQRVRGRDNLVETLRADPELMAILRKDVLAVTETVMPPTRRRKVTVGRKTTGSPAPRKANSKTTGNKTARRVRQRPVEEE